MGFRIFDASAFYAGIPFADSSIGYTTTKIFEEIKHIKKNHDAIQILLDTQRLLIKDPNLETINIVKKNAKKTGDYNQLSESDFSVLALTVELKGELVSDDFALSNLGKSIGIKIIPIMTSGIKELRKTTLYCPGCNENFENGKTCPNCGTVLKKRSSKRKSFSVPFNK